MTSRKIRKAVFPVGGLGTRFLPATKAMPKEMLPVAGKPLIQHAFEEARDAGIEQFIFITGRNKNIINNHFDHSYELQDVLNDTQKAQELEMVTKWLPEAGSIIFIRQQEPLGLGHAIWCARNVVNDEPFVVILADEVLKHDTHLTQHMIEEYEKMSCDCNIIGTSPVDHSQISKYGIVEVNNHQNNPTTTPIPITNMIEKPSLDQTDSNLSIVGRYILSSNIFKYLEKAKKTKNNEIQLTDAMLQMLQDKHEFYNLSLQGERHDCGSYGGFLMANIAYAMEDPLMRSRIEDMVLTKKQL